MTNTKTELSGISKFIQACVKADIYDDMRPMWEVNGPESTEVTRMAGFSYKGSVVIVQEYLGKYFQVYIPASTENSADSAIKGIINRLDN